MRLHVRVSTHVQNPQKGTKNRPSLSTVQSHMSDRNFVVATATLVSVTFAFTALHYVFLSLMKHLKCFNNKRLCISDRQILDRTCNCNYFRAIAHADKGAFAKLTLLHQYLPGMDYIWCSSQLLLLGLAMSSNTAEDLIGIRTISTCLA